MSIENIVRDQLVLSAAARVATAILERPDGDDRRLAIAAAYASLSTLLSLHAFENQLGEWEVIPIKERREIIGAVMVKGNEIHVGVKRRPSGSMRGYIRTVLQEVIARHGCAVTSVMLSNADGMAMCAKLGFYEVSRTETMAYLRCEKAVHG